MDRRRAPNEFQLSHRCSSILISAMNDNGSIQFFITYVPSQQLHGQLQTQHCVDTGN
jgi:hypothetical protein